jgi:outer membrane protein TolC
MAAFCFRKFLWLFSTGLLMPALSLFAQQKKYSVSDYIDAAQQHLPLLMEKKALAAASQAAVTDARHSYLPVSYLGDEITAGTDNSIPGSYLSFGVIPSSSSGVRSANEYQAALGNIAFFYNEYELLNFGLKKATVNHAAANSNLSQADLDREIYLVKWQVCKFYLEILKDEFQLGIDRQNINRYEKIYSVILALTNSGIRPGADSALALAELSRTRINFNQTFGQIRQLEQELSYLTGIPTDDLTVDTTRTKSFLPVPDIPGLPVDSVAAANPLFDYYNKQKELYQQTENLVKKTYLPKVYLTGVTWARGSSYDYTDAYKNTLSGLGYQRFNYMAGLTMVYNLFQPVHRKDKVSIIQNEVNANDYALQQQQRSLENLSNKAEERIRTAVKNLQEVPIQIKAANNAYDQKTAQYKAGIINLVDLTNASFVLYRSQSDYVQTLSEWLLANLDKSAALGSLDNFIQTIK